MRKGSFFGAFVYTNIKAYSMSRGKTAVKEFEGKQPDLDPKSFLADGARVIGKVKMKQYSSMWCNAVARGDVNRIEIGQYSNVQDNSVLHVADDNPCILGDFVTVGHSAVVHGAVIEDHCLIGIGAIVLTGAVVGRGSIVAAGALVREGQIIPPHSLVVGVPAKVVRTIESEWGSIHAQALKYKTLWT